jgi:excinuclease ABC subunit A
VPPAIAIDQTNPVRTSRSTVGTMTELNDHLKLLFARAATLHCRGCGQPVREDTPATIAGDIAARAAAAGDPRLVVTAPVTVPATSPMRKSRAGSPRQGYTRIHARDGSTLHVVQDRFRAGNCRAKKKRARDEALEAALRARPGPSCTCSVLGDGAVTARWKFSSRLHCADCDIAYSRSAAGALLVQLAAGRLRNLPRLRPRHRHRLRGWWFRTNRKTLAGGAIKPWQTESYKECQDRPGKDGQAKRGVAMDMPARAARRTPPAGCSRATRNGRAGRSPGPAPGTACATSSSGWKPRPTRCTSACCCRATARTRRARLRWRRPQARCRCCVEDRRPRHP